MHRPIETIKRSIPVSDEEIEILGKQGWWIAGGANGYIYFQRDGVIAATAQPEDVME